MRRPPRKKNDPIITRRFLYRVLFSASNIALGTLFIYYIALVEDNEVSRREQTMVRASHISMPLATQRGSLFQDLYVLCSPRPCFRGPESRSWVWAVAKQDAGHDCVGVGAGAACAGLCAFYASDLPDGGAC